MTADNPQSFWMIDPPVSPWSPLQELLEWRDECRAMLAEHPGNPQWLAELRDVEVLIADRKDKP